MEFDKEMIDQLLNGSEEALIYGFGDCHLYTIASTLRKQGYDAYTCSNSPFLIIDPYDISTYHCKKIIVNLMEENYKRQQKGEPVIPLIFVVGFEDGKNNVELDIKRVASSHNTNLPDTTSVTDTELRRCYKIYAESNDVMRKVAEETFKFVIFKFAVDETYAHSSCELVPVDPFWVKPEWDDLWLKRTRKNPLRDYSIWNKKGDDNWRGQLDEVVSKEVNGEWGDILGLCNVL